MFGTRSRVRESLAAVVPLGLLLSIVVSTPALSGDVAIRETILSDNGDDDGFADTNETVSMTLTLQNTSGTALTGLRASLATDDPTLVCPTVAEINVGDLAAGEIRQTDEAFVFHVADVDRAALGLGPLDALSASFTVLFTALPFDPPAHPSKITVDLDLDVSGGSGPTQYFESFEVSSGLSSFTRMNLDFGRNNFDGSDGYRCAYSDPDWPNSRSYGVITDCFLAATPTQADEFFWQVHQPTAIDGGRAYHGFRSLYMGIFGPVGDDHTTPMATLEAVRTNNPISLGWDGVNPTLSFKHQVSLMDSRTSNNVPVGESIDRGVVMAQLADAGGNAVGNWIKLYPYQNVYDQQGTDDLANCMFDPVDDGSTEDDFFHPSDPNRFHGPSSTCWPEYNFSVIGETASPYDPANVGLADGPGLPGSLGLGTWIESRFDLSRFRGRRIRIRFLTTALKVGTFESYQQIFQHNPSPGDDGWWIDEVLIEDVLASPAAVSVDNRDNSALPGLPVGLDVDGDGACDAGDNCPGLGNPAQADTDGDGWGVVCDCVDTRADVYPGSTEVNDGLDNTCPGELGYGVIDETSGNSGFHDPGDTNVLSWTAQPGATLYEVARSNAPDFSVGCVVNQATEPFWEDLEEPPAGGAFYYLNRPLAPNVGSWGQNSEGNERIDVCG